MRKISYLHEVFDNQKTGEMLSFLRLFAILIIACFIVKGCSLIKLNKEVAKGLEGTSIVGRIQIKNKQCGPLIVAAYSKGEEKKIAHYTILHGSGEYELGLAKGEYYVFAYEDRNSNLIYDEGEPAGHFGSPDLVDARYVNVVFDIDVQIPAKGKVVDIPPGFEISSIKPKKLLSRQAGAITSLDDKRFSRENGIKGFWEPYQFFSELGGNVYFLEEYNPDKTPILFIHGAADTPKTWKYITDRIDRTRFQPWFFYYPSGFRIEGMSHLLLWKLVNLQTKYQFNRIYITAHSMGGLLAKSFIANYGRQFPYVKLFISLATPWGGNKMAEFGVKQSPVVIPSWIDMQPESDLIASLYRVNLPEETDFYMFSGHKGSRNPFSSNNDGTIELSSIQDLRAQSEANMNYSFNEDHSSILQSREVAKQYNAILNKYEQKQNASFDQTGGYFRVNFSYDFKYDGIRPRPAFILQSVEKDEAESTIFLNNGSTGRILGPYPPGKYIASMVTAAAKTKRKFIPISVEGGTTKDLDFVFETDGVIQGAVRAPLIKEEVTVGMPEWRYRTVDSKITIQSITLEGNNIHRTLRQVKGEEISIYDPFIWRNDLCYNRYFAFFGIPEGDYKLSIKAAGYKTVESQYSVIPGKPASFRITELQPE